MDLSQEKQVKRIPEEEWLQTVNREKIPPAPDPLENLRDVLMEALGGKSVKRVPLSEQNNDETSQKPTADRTLTREWKSGESVENGGRDRAVKKRDRPTPKPPKNGEWRTITVNHYAIPEVANQSTPAGSSSSAPLGENITQKAHSPDENEFLNEVEINSASATAKQQTVPGLTEPETDLNGNDLTHQGNSTTHLNEPFSTESYSNQNVNSVHSIDSPVIPETNPESDESSAFQPENSDPEEDKWPTLTSYSPQSNSPVIPELSELQANSEAVLAGMEQLESLFGIETPGESSPTHPGSGESLQTVDPMASLQQLLFGTQLSDLDRLKQSLMENDIPGLRELLVQTNSNLQSLESQIYDPQKLIELLKPWIAEILSRKISDSKEEVAKALVPIIDEVIKNRSHENKAAMSSAIASILPSAITQQIKESPQDVAKALGPEMAMAIKEQIRLDRNSIAQVLAPEMGRTIKEQIRLERDAMVDALYPVIGNTISKYMTEAIQSINDKVSNALSMEGVERKIRSKVQGVSEAELILQESIPFVVQAVFLIHKASGLVIAEIQEEGDYCLESEMVAGMLTAIRSFVNDCIVKPGEISELNEIEYGDAKIILEVGGYCYLAVIVKGNPSKAFIQKMRKTVSILILDYEQPIQEFDGDPANVPPRIQELVNQLIESTAPKADRKPYTLLGLVLGGGILMLVVWMGFFYYSTVQRRIQSQVALALSSTPELAVYRLDIAAKRKRVIISGKLPNPELRQQAAEIAAAAAGDRILENQIIAVDVPPDPTLVRGEVARVSEVFNQRNGVEIAANYEERTVTIAGTVMEMSQANQIVQGFQQIPGVNSVVSTLKLDPLTIQSRIYFDAGSARLNPSYEETLATLKEFLEQYPEKNLRIIGHSDRTGSPAINQRLALQRAQAVQTALIELGIQPTRLEAIGDSNPPQDVDSSQPKLLGRVVLFEPITPEPEN
ncbi:outer membrane protein/peptidoglycan-associated (lipo)protein [Oscillatoria acuminata PCC 6304]|uniref:Outer membrane protein/peptidoglycan-associated (Lipo)protein n=2 Tax=Oscillatoria acuminata TaxID=118323 RepID=K9TJ88_9CYAN|nr:outer membrane protein/peptidoglycan-associated (lipo)protein [Oscillatoria acuminata PCC 6304]